jgi:hypothetical protein
LGAGYKATYKKSQYLWKAPFNVAIIHGGPGAPGSMVMVARELASHWGILEPLQTVTSLEGQMQELQELPGSVFPPGVEKTYNRSFVRLIAIFADKGGRKG